MKKSSFHILRVGIAITFIWIGVLILRQPEAWGGYLMPWAAALLPVSVAQVMICTAIIDILIGFFLLIGWQVWTVGLIGGIHLVIVLIVSGITDITVRDIGLLTGIIALLAESLPPSIINELKPKQEAIVE